MKKTVPISYGSRIIGTATIQMAENGMEMVTTVITDRDVLAFLSQDSAFSIIPKEKQDGQQE